LASGGRRACAPRRKNLDICSHIAQSFIRMKPPPFVYHDPTTVDEATDLIGRLDNALPLARLGLGQNKCLVFGDVGIVARRGIASVCGLGSRPCR
jgi:hypothetical protein